ncbi:hypothetical protein EVG20_g6277 [Dentipellis fragilis]|uniref:Uncharacterized protein n=1 Tax=Dentipellis fragilis TaxID=205917 RepID=A0A4Y9YPB7_9AGAM|nr:hypothetical protein EVG20_g6277 [Dentipellis fragilis]
MSFTVDDLVSSFSSNHIGQESIDLAALQAQLATTLFTQSSTMASGMNGQSIPRKGSFAQPCNTPTATAPAFRWEEDTRSHAFDSSNSFRGFEDGKQSELDDMEEEQMVEDLLVSPTAAVPQRPLSQPLSPPLSHSSRFPTSHAHTTPATPHFIESPTQTSLFATTDPFYIAASQAAASRSPASSFFAQHARPSFNSPFMLNASSQQQHGMAMDVEARPVLAGGAFDR